MFQINIGSWLVEKFQMLMVWALFPGYMNIDYYSMHMLTYENFVGLKTRKFSWKTRLIRFQSSWIWTFYAIFSPKHLVFDYFNFSTQILLFERSVIPNNVEILLKIGDFVQLRVDEMIPSFLELGETLQETTRLQQQHMIMMEKLGVKFETFIPVQ